MTTRNHLAQFYKTASPEYLKAGIGFAVSIGLTIVPGSASKYLALPVLGLSLGYGLAIASDNQRVTKWVSQKNREVEGLEQKLENVQKLLKQAEQGSIEAHQEAAKWAQKAEQSSKDACSLIRKEIEALEAQLESRKRIIEAESLVRIKSRNSEHRRREQEWLAYHDLLEASLEMLQSTHSEDLEKVRDRIQAQLEEELEAMQSEFAQKEELWQANWQLAKMRYDELIQHYKGITVMYPGQLDVIEAQVSAQMTAIIEERDRIYNQLQRYHDAKRFTGSTSADLNGNRLIDFFLGQKIVCDADHCKGCYEFDEIWLRPRTDTLEGLEKYVSAISLEFELLEDVKFSREHGCIKAVLKHHSKEKSATSMTIDDREDWLMVLVRQSNHYRIAAPTGEGKSVFLDNLVSALQISQSGLEVTLLDPKYPFTQWRDKVPTYTGCAACLLGMEDLGKLIETRFAEATEDVEAGNPIRDFPPHLFAIDELEYLYDFARNPESGKSKDSQAPRLSYLMKNGLRLGRGLKGNDISDGKGLIVAYITQSPLCSRIGFNKSDFDNSTNIWLGKNIPAALENELPTYVHQKQLAYLHKQHSLRKERGDEYIALVATPKDVFLASLPSEGHYAKLLFTKQGDNYQELGLSGGTDHELASSPESLENRNSRHSTPKITAAPQPPNQHPISTHALAPHCPQCGSSATRKDGTKRGIQYYKCKEATCKKSFSVR